MTTSTSTPDSLKAKIAKAPKKTTVFSDGSTFDYTNGYQNNGAPVATRDRGASKIVKTGTIMTWERQLAAVAVTGAAIVLAGVTLAYFALSQEITNEKAIVAAINDSGYEVVAGSPIHGNVTVRDTSNDNYFKWDVVKAHEGATPVALVFTAPGEGAERVIALPHDPSNLLYVAPAKEDDKH